MITRWLATCPILWATMPDAELLRLAAAGQLSDRHILLGKHDDFWLILDRMRLCGILQIGGWDFINWVRARMKTDLVRGTITVNLNATVARKQSIFRHILDQNLSVSHFINSDLTFVNYPLPDCMVLRG